ncbi:hypothetical protein XENOCAPTIV_029549, partial [Xenoophorus captivus]
TPRGRQDIQLAAAACSDPLTSLFVHSVSFLRDISSQIKDLMLSSHTPRLRLTLPSQAHLDLSDPDLL